MISRMESFSQSATINAKKRFSITKYTSNYFSLVVSVKGIKGNPLLCSAHQKPQSKSTTFLMDLLEK